MIVRVNGAYARPHAVHSAHVSSLAGAACLALLATSVFAQTSPAGTAAQGGGTVDNGGALEEIVVTAQKRREDVQTTPLSIVAVKGDQLAAQGVTQVQDFNHIDSGLQTGEATGALVTFIRGIGNPVNTPGNEASVPIYIDDVYYVRAAAPFLDLPSVDQVEVLKGPQGTLFGRNASGGVISVYTKDPSQVPEMTATVGYGNYQTFDGKFYGNLPLNDVLAANFSLSEHHQSEGWGENKQLVDPLNTSLGYKPGGQDYWYGHSLSMRAKLLYQPNDSTSIKLIAYYEDSWTEIGDFSRPFPGTVGGSPDPAHNNGASLALIPGGAPTPSQVLPPLGFYDVALAHPQYDESHGWGTSLRLDQEFSFANFVSISAYRKADEFNFTDGNYSPYSWIYYHFTYQDEQYSQEFQLKSKDESWLKWIVGTYYLNAKEGFVPALINGPGETGNGIDNIMITGEQEVNSYAGFGQVTAPVGERTNVTGGFRYTRDDIKADGETVVNFLPGVLGPGAVALVTQRFDASNDFGGDTGRTIIKGSNPQANPIFNKPTWKLGVDHEFTSDLMAYVNYSRGYKAGAFNVLPLNNFVLKPEVVDAYELGAKSEFAQRRVRLDGAFFWNKISNPQVSGVKNGLIYLQNAGSAETRGFDFDAMARVTDSLGLRVSGTYLEATFTNFSNAATYCPSPQISAAECQLLSPVPPLAPGNLNPYTINASGHEMPYASRWKLLTSADYAWNLGHAGSLAFDLTGNYQSSYFWDADNVIQEPAHFFLDGSIAYTPDVLSSRSILRFWMKNITGVHYNVNYVAQASGSAYSSAPGAPRTFGANVTYHF